ncbi:MAG: SpoIIE family protein phosphatase [Vicingaceae bacterium]
MRLLLTFLAILTFSFHTFSQTNYEVTHYTVEDGLMSNDIRDIFQDSLGVIWVENGLGFTKFYGDKIENITGLKNEEWGESFQVSKGRIFNAEYYYESSSNALKRRYKSNLNYKNEKYNYIIGLWKDSKSNELKLAMSDTPLNDEFGNQYYFKIHEKDTFFYKVDFYGKDTTNLSALINQKKSFQTAQLMLGQFDSKSNYSFSAKEEEVFIYSPHTNTLDSFPNIKGFVRFFELQDGSFALHLKKEVKNTSLMLTTTNQDGSISQESIQEFNSYLIVYDKQKSKITDSVKLGKWPRWGSGLEHKVDKGNADWFLNNGNTLLKIKEGKLEEKIVSNEEILDYEFNSANTLKYLIKRYGKTILVSKSQGYELSFPSDRFFIDKQDNLFFPTNPGFYKLTSSNYEFKEWTDFKGNSKNVQRLYSWIPNQYIIDTLYRKVELLFKAPFIYGLTNDSLFLIQEHENYGGNTAKFLKYKNDLYCEIISFKNQTKYLLKIDSNLNVKQIELNGKINFILNKEVLSSVNKQGVYTIRQDKFYSQKSWSDSLNLEKVLHRSSFKQISKDFLNQTPVALEIKSDSTSKILLYDPKINKLNANNANTLNKLLHSPASLGNSKWFALTKDKLLLYNHAKLKSIDNSVLNYNGEEYISIMHLQDKYSNVYLGGDYGLGLAFIPSSLDTIYKLKPEADPEFFNRDFRDIRLSEDSNKLWMLSNQGLHSLDLEKFNQSGTIDLENFIIPETQGYKIQSIGDSILMNFNVDGIAYLKIGDNRFIPSAPQIHFTSLRKDYNTFNWTNTTNKIDSSYGNVMPYNMNLSHDQNHLTFDYQGVSHSNKKPLIYFHQLVGLDTNFVGTTSKSATYSNLEPGDYTFKVFAQDENDNASRVIECSFSIAPPYWETWWFISLCVLAIGSTVYSAYQYNIRRLKARQAELESEVDAATFEIREQKDEIEEAHREITDSIAYAKRIQSAILPPLKLVKEQLESSFILYKPKDVVAGDFYWMTTSVSERSRRADVVYFAAADCTGHGVPGAMVSVVCNNALNRSVKEFGLTEPGEILDKTRELVIAEFEKSEEEVQDGMDIALCSLRTSSGVEKPAELKYAGAHNPLWLIRKGKFEESNFPEGSRFSQSEDEIYQLVEVKADKQPIGKYASTKPYTTHTFELQKGDTLYLFSDGFVDQFGGDKGKKFKSLNFKRLLLSIQEKDMDIQRQLIDEAFEEWKKGLEQIDDVCVIGVRI